MLELLRRKIATPTPHLLPITHRSLAILIGQKRTCHYFSHGRRRIDFIMLLFETCLLFLHLIYMAKKISLRCVHYKELRVFTPLENSYILQ